jgi:2-polyprenyl-6-methoxyphenol hydroxylase-like FAD-dependent oxidoreductase
MGNISKFDFIVLGLGPSGLMAAAYLARMGYRVVAVERHKALYGLPRAGHIDHEIVRSLQELEIVDRFLPDAHPVSNYTWFNADGQVLLKFEEQDSVSGYASDYMMYQPVLEDAFVHAIDTARQPTKMFRGYDLIDFVQDDQQVTARIRPSEYSAEGAQADTSADTTISARYLLAADGARSLVRQQLGIERTDLGFNEVWLVVDTRLKRPIDRVEPYQICDPARPIYIGPLGRRHYRWEWAILPGENSEDFTKAEMAWSLLAKQGIGPDDVEIVRQQVYVFEARVAEHWRDGRVFLLGDAAHTMPPFMGQGACSGMRDAVNLAWKFDLVLRGIASDALLDTYDTERKPHVLRWIELSMRTGEISCTLDPEIAAKRDMALLSGDAAPLPEFPYLQTGLIDDAEAGRHPLVGKAFPQREVALNGRSGLFDDLAGSGFLLVGREPLDADISTQSADALDRIGVRRLAFSADHQHSALSDPQDFYSAWFDKHGIASALVRPDRFIYGVARNAAELNAMILRLADGLGVAAPSPEELVPNG